MSFLPRNSITSTNQNEVTLARQNHEKNEKTIVLICQRYSIITVLIHRENTTHIPDHKLLWINRTSVRRCDIKNSMFVGIELITVKCCPNRSITCRKIILARPSFIKVEKCSPVFNSNGRFKTLCRLQPRNLVKIPLSIPSQSGGPCTTLPLETSLNVNQNKSVFFGIKLPCTIKEQHNDKLYHSS